MDTTRNELQKRLTTLESLIRGGGSLRRGTGRAGGMANALTAGWETEAQIIRRVLGEAGDPVARLESFRERTEQFRAKYPARDGWTDQQGGTWDAALVLAAIDNLLAHIENWENGDNFEDDDEEEGEEL